ncbi:sexual development protein [Diplodia corticola]|uniref:Sexual development protein n=1 Tax=Diplodia corticola TaxID=236234 RepID=A0A1J9QS99_9PEZI|nr:sexual development protein [Diplodia corticola]OJD31297.1 sexual development protein [Diplodia corticola]
MHSNAPVAALLGFAASLAAAAPANTPVGTPVNTPNSQYYSTPAPSGGDYGNSDYGYGSESATGKVITVSYDVSPIPTEVHPDGDKFRFPLSNDFPNPDQKEVDDIQEIAGGTLPNGGGGDPPSGDALTSLRLIAFNEIFEVAFFTDLLKNITENVHGYRVEDATKLNIDMDDLIIILATVQAQEELHALNANGALQKFNAGPIQPCEYVFGVDNLKDAIATAATFTDVVLGTLQDVENDFGLSGDIGLIRGVASVIGQEGEQNGFYRLFQGKRPSAEPFLTASTREFAFSALNQNFVVEGTCPNIDTIDLPIFEPLKLIGQPQPKDSIVTFQIQCNGTIDEDGLSLVLINGQNLPIIEKLQNVKKMDHDVIQFDAAFPFDTNLLFGLTIAVVTNTDQGLTDVDKVADATVFGPALIEVN